MSKCLSTSTTMKNEGKRKSESTTMNWGGERKSEERKRSRIRRRTKRKTD